MAQPPNVFITWSKERSRAAAVALREWLPQVIHAAKPWMSDKDIVSGKVWLNELVKALSSVKLGIVCLTPESLSEPWLLFETGVIFRGLEESRVWTYLLGGLKPADVPLPLGLFQHTVATKAETFKLLESINEAMEDRGVSSEILKKQFEMYWPELEPRLEAVSGMKAAAVPQRPEREMLAEILELVRAAGRGVFTLRELEEALERQAALERLTGGIGAQKAQLHQLIGGLSKPETLEAATLWRKRPRKEEALRNLAAANALEKEKKK